MNKRLPWGLRTLAAAGMAAAATTAAAQPYPSRPITLVLPYSAGGPTDQHLRVVAEEAAKVLGQPIVVENRPGGSGTNGAVALSRAAPDGYTLAVLPGAVYREPFIAKAAFDPATSFSYIALLSDYAFGLAVRADAPWKTWKDFAADAKARPGTLNVGATGAVGTPRIVVDEVADAAGIKLNVVPFKGDADVANALLGGHIDAAPLSGVAVPHIEGGRLRYLGMFTPKRAKRFPEVPTLEEQGMPAGVIDSPYGVAGPKNLPPAIVKTLNEAFHKGLESPASLQTMERLNQPMNYLGPEAYRQYALQALAREKLRVARLRERGLLD